MIDSLTVLIGRSNPLKLAATGSFVMVEQALQFVDAVFAVTTRLGMVKGATGFCAVGEKLASS